MVRHGMKIVRFIMKDALSGDAAGPRFGELSGDMIEVFAGSPFNQGTAGEPSRSGERIPLSQARLLAPCVPTKALCVGLNYRDHAMELSLPIPTSPVIFMKPPTCVIGPGDCIEYPAMSSRLDYEGELAVVIGKRARNVSAADAAYHVLGYTCANDVTARDLQPKDGQWTVAKSFDTFLPLGPWIVTGLDTSNLALSTRLEGREVQRSNTSNLIFRVPELVAYLSSIMTLEPGDVIITGTPSGIGPMRKGDRVEVSIEGIGTLSNTVR